MPRPNHDFVLRHAFLFETLPEDLAVLELQPPIAGPGGDRPGADPAPAIADDDATLEYDRCHSDRRTAEGGPFGVPGFAVDPLRLTVENHSQQVEMVDRHVDQQGLLFDLVPALTGRVAAKIN